MIGCLTSSWVPDQQGVDYNFTEIERLVLSMRQFLASTAQVVVSGGETAAASASATTSRFQSLARFQRRLEDAEDRPPQQAAGEVIERQNQSAPASNSLRQSDSSIEFAMTSPRQSTRPTPTAPPTANVPDLTTHTSIVSQRQSAEASDTTPDTKTLTTEVKQSSTSRQVQRKVLRQPLPSATDDRPDQKPATESRNRFARQVVPRPVRASQATAKSPTAPVERNVSRSSKRPPASTVVHDLSVQDVVAGGTNVPTPDVTEYSGEDERESAVQLIDRLFASDLEL